MRTTDGRTARAEHLHPGRGRRAAVAAAIALSLLPRAPAAREPERSPGDAAPEIVADALFLCDPLPPGSRDLSLSFALARGEPDPLTGEAGVVASPRLQLAAPLGERLGFTVDVGLGTAGDVALDSPGASLKALLREPGAGRIGLAASVDLFGSTRALRDAEIGVGLGALGGAGPLGLRASASVVTPLSGFTPRLHAGASAAIALGGRLRAFAEVTAELSRDEVSIAAGPTVKVQLGEATALVAGALLPVRPAAPAAPLLVLQLTQTL